jgi:asparagine synthase (glutamine-hydrolysing)
MCGIAGWYRRSNGLVSQEIIQAQCDRIIHRGPDEQGILIDGDFGFGMRRLSIIDISGGSQPISSPDGSISIIFNGEIFNHPELRQELQALGHFFKSHSDTETILHGFMEWGHGIWPKLEGMFAIAIWEHNTRCLHLARDPLGIKPLYYTLQNGELAFGSELKTLAPIPSLSFDSDSFAINSFFALGYILPPHTIYSEIKKLDPGNTLTIGATGQPLIHRFWQLNFREQAQLTEKEYIEQFREKFTSTVKRHLLSDVPYGAFLSGGVDSSAVVAAMSRVSPEPVHTFTIGFKERRYDESEYAELIAKHLGCIHTHRYIELENASVLLPKLAACYDEPFADPSAIPTWYVSKLAHEHVKVVLAGDGGDELFAGYTRHLSEKLIQTIKQIPLPVLRISALVYLLPTLPNRRWNYFQQRLKKIHSAASLPSTYQRFFVKNQFTSPQFRSTLYHPEFTKTLHLDDELNYFENLYFPENNSRDAIENFLYADTVIRLPNTMLTKVDRASMAHSLEVRVPFLAHTFVDWSSQVPVSMKIKGNKGKYIVRKAIEDWLPAGILDRPKQGFTIPLADWFHGDLGHYAETVWHDTGAIDAPFLNKNKINTVFKEHRSGRKDYSHFLYALTMFSLWWQNRLGATNSQALQRF